MGLVHWACDRGNLNMVKLLVKSGTDVNIQDTDNQTPLHYGERYFTHAACVVIHVEASCLFVDLCFSPMLPLLNTEASQFCCVSMVT